MDELEYKRELEKRDYIENERRETVRTALEFADQHADDMPVGSLAHVIASCWAAGMAQMARKLDLMPKEDHDG